MARTPHTCGTTMKGCPTRSRRARGASKGTPSCRRCMLWVSTQLSHEGEMLFAFLDNIYILCDPSRVGEIFLQVLQSLARFAGVQVNLEKTKVWNRAATRPEDLHTIGAEAWRGEGPEEEQGLVVLGVPVGHSAFVQKWLADEEEVSSAVSHPNTSCSGRTVCVAATHDVCWTQSKPHPSKFTSV